MSYVVLARKYRPKSFADIIGQEHVVRTLENAIELSRVHHAFLFTGARGVGKTTTARVLARALNCERGPTTKPCGQCAACTEVASGANPDVIEIDGASNNGVEDIRELRENARYMPNRGRFKLYIIDEVHMLSAAAFNALLKTLEEPPAHVKFIFATTEPHKIPVTILSRCQRFDFRRVSVQTLTEHLRGILASEGMQLSAGSLAAVVREAQGSVRDALSLLDQVLSYAGGKPGDEQVLDALGIVDRQTIFDLANAVLSRRAETLLDTVARVDARGHDLADVAALFLEHLRDLMVAKVVERPAEQVLERSPGEIEQLKKQAAGVSSADLHRLFAIMVAVAEDVGKSPHPRVSLEMGLLRLLEVEPSASLAAVIERLDGLVGGSSSVSASAPRAAPRSEKAPAAGSAEGHNGWTRLVARVRELKPALASVLEHGRVAAFGPGGVKVGFLANTFYWESAKDEENRKLVQGVLEQQLGVRVPMHFEPLEESLPAATESIAEATERSRQEKLQQITDGAVAHPVVQSATRILGGEIKKVVPLISSE